MPKCETLGIGVSTILSFTFFNWMHNPFHKLYWSKKDNAMV